MSSSEVSQSIDWTMVAAIGQCIGAVSAVLALIGIGVLIWQIKDNRRWNKLNFAFNFLPNPIEFEKIEQEIDKTINLWGRKANESLSEAEIKALFGCSLTDHEKSEIKNIHSIEFNSDTWKEAGRKLKLYMNLIEEYSTSIIVGAADSDAAKHIYSYKFKTHYNKLKPYIEWIRKDRLEPGIYVEFEKLVTELWFPEPKQGAKKSY